MITEDSLSIDLTDGRTIIVPLMWYPRLWYGTPEERNHFEIIGNNTLIHWPDLDEDLRFRHPSWTTIWREPRIAEEMACPEKCSEGRSFVREEPS